MTTAPNPEPAAPDRRSRLLRKLVTWIVLVALFALLFRKVPLPEVLAQFRAMTLTSVLALFALSLVFILGVCALDGAAMGYGFSLFGVKIPLREIVLARTARMLLDSIATILGQAGLAAHVAKRYQLPAGPAAGMVLFLFLVEIYGMVVVSTLSLLALALLPGRLQPGAPLAAAVTMAGLAWPALAVMVFGGQRLARNAALARLLTRLRLAPILSPLSRLRPAQLLRLLLYKTALAAWQIGLTIVAFRLYGLKTPALDLLAFMPLAILVSSIPVTPSRLGTTQWSWTFFFAYTAPSAALVAMSLLLQFLLNTVRWIIGAAATLWLYRQDR
jgi:uncharacterized membrane protein YbhN (UPF0104 family)